MEPIIDPALLEEEAKGAEDDDLEDAEGELVDEMTEEQYAAYSSYHANDPTAGQATEGQPVYNGDYERYYDYPNDAELYASDHIDAVMPDAGPSRMRGHRSESHASYSQDVEAVSTDPTVPKRRGRPPKNLQLPPPLDDSDMLLPRPKKGRPRSKMPARIGKGRDSLEDGEYNPGPPDTLCSFCYGPNESNRAGQPEKMVTCVWCKRSGHPSCLSMFTQKIISNVFSYDWYCQVCKTCEVCKQKGRESNLMFCDGCDRGWHTYCLNPPLVKPPKGKWVCPKCRPTTTSATPQPPPSVSKLKVRDDHHAVQPAISHTVTPVIKRPRGRPRKNPLVETPRLDEEEDLLHDSAVKVKAQSARRGRKAKSADIYSDSDDDKPPPTRMKIRLRLSGGARKRTVEVESEEEKVPYGGVITGEDADTSKTTIGDKDKEAFDKSRQVAEMKLGGPPPLDDTPVGAGSPAPSSNGYFPSPGPATPAPTASVQRGLRDRLLQSSLSFGTPGNSLTMSKLAGAIGTGVAEKIKTIRFGPYDIDTWYSAPYPEEYQHVPEGRLWLCEFCLKYMKSGFVSERHRMKCKARHPPGDEIYRKDNVSVFEVDGRKNKIYCQNLCLLAKMFLDHKTLYYDVEPFLFYVMTEVDDLGARFVGYFSKEKRSPDNNVSCIMTLPVRQRKGWGQLLIDFSYLLSKKEERVGGPERPLSGLGEVTYKKYWRLAVFRFLRNSPSDPSLEDISKATSMTIPDVYQTLKDQDMIVEHDTPPPTPHLANGHSTPSIPRRRGRGRGSRLGSARRPVQHRSPTPEKAAEDKIIIPERYTVKWDREYVEAVVKKHGSRGYLELAPERLKYHPFLVTRNPIKPPGALAQAALAAGNGANATTQTAVELTEPIEGDQDDSQAIGDEIDHDLEETVHHGEDRATLDLVASLAHEPSSRNLRKRTSSELNTPGPASVKKLRGSERVKSASESPARHAATRTRSNGDHRGATSNGTAKAGQRVTSGRALRMLGRDADSEMDSDGSDDPLRLSNGTPQRPRRSMGTDGTPTRASKVNGGGHGRLGSKAISTKLDDEDMDAEGEVDGEGDVDADGEWEADKDADADAEGEDDEDYAEE